VWLAKGVNRSKRVAFCWGFSSCVYVNVLLVVVVVMRGLGVCGSGQGWNRCEQSGILEGFSSSVV